MGPRKLLFVPPPIDPTGCRGGGGEGEGGGEIAAVVGRGKGGGEGGVIEAGVGRRRGGWKFRRRIGAKEKEEVKEDDL